MRALVADDDRVTRTVLTAALQRLGVDAVTADDGLEAWQQLTSGAAPAFVIADWMMPRVDGLELCRRIRREPALAATYVLLLTARTGREDLIAGLDAGADDFMSKPIDADELRARVQVAIRVATLQSQLADRVNELQATRDHLVRLASIDMLTEVYTRRWWFEQATTEFSRCRRYERTLGLVAVDLDFFKRINDTHGHASGDLLLQRFAELLRRECRQSDVIGRLGGEEFAVLMPEASIDAAARLAARIIEGCRRIAVPSDTGTVACTCSIGVSELRAADENIEAVLRRADAALYDAKRGGRDGWKRDDELQPVA